MADTSTSGPKASAADAKKPRGKSRRKLFILAGLIVFVLAGGGGAYVMMGPTPESEQAVDATPAVEPSSFAYLALEPFVVRAIDANGQIAAVTLVISLELSDDDAGLGHFERMRPRVHDAVLRGLHRPLMRLDAEKGHLDIYEVKARVAAASSGVLGDGVVKGVLMQGEL